MINRYAKVSALRDAELGAAWAGMLVSIANTVVTRSATLVITLLTFAVYVRGGSWATWQNKSPSPTGYYGV